MRRRAGLLFPVVQLLSAGVTFVSWIVVSRFDAQLVDVPIRAYAYGAPLSLILHGGLVYVLPNYFRNTMSTGRAQHGPWSEPVAVSMVMVVAGALVGIVLIALGGGLFTLPGTVLVTAATIAAGILLAQVGRATDRLQLALLGAIATPSVPVTWLILLGPLTGTGHPYLAAGIALLAVTIGLTYAVMPLARLSTVVASAPQHLRRSASLIPHLLCFGLLMQGVRFTETFVDNTELLLPSHQLMLVLGLGLTFMASFHAWLGVRIQSLSGEVYSDELGPLTIQYAWLGGIAALGVLGALSAGNWFGLISVAIDHLEGSLAVLCVVLSIAGYYALSAQLMRDFRGKALSLASGLAVGVLILGTLVLRPRALTGLLDVYALACICLLVITSWLVRRGSQRGRYNLGAAFPAGVVTVLWLTTVGVRLLE